MPVMAGPAVSTVKFVTSGVPATPDWVDAYTRKEYGPSWSPANALQQKRCYRDLDPVALGLAPVVAHSRASRPGSILFGVLPKL